MNVLEIAQAAGVSMKTAYKRRADYCAGLITREQALAPPLATLDDRSRAMGGPTVAELAAATGLTRGGALTRIKRFVKGELDRDTLFRIAQPGVAFKAKTHTRRRNVTWDCSREGDWGDLGLGPRRKLDSIKGVTELERRMFGGDE